MNNKPFISNKQVSRLLLGYTLGASLLIMPSKMAQSFGESAWLFVIGYGLIFTFGAWLTARLAEKYPDDTLVEFGPKLLGKTISFLINLGLSAYFLALVFFQTRAMVELANIAIIPFGPGWFIAGFFLLAVMYGVIKGLDTFVQLNELLIGLALFIGIVVCVLGWQNFKVLHLFPIFNIKQINLKSPMQLAALSSAFIGYPILFFITPFINKPSGITKRAVRTMFFITIIYSFLVLTVIGVFGAKETMNQGWPVLELAKSVNLSGILLERLDLVFLLAWIPAVYTSATVSFFFGVDGMSRLFKIRWRSPLIWILTVLLFITTNLIANYFHWMRIGNYLAITGIFFSLAVPLLLWAAYLFRGKDRR